MEGRRLKADWVEKKLNSIDAKLDRVLRALEPKPAAKKSVPKSKEELPYREKVVETKPGTYSIEMVCRQCGIFWQEGHRCLSAIEEEKK